MQFLSALYGFIMLNLGGHFVHLHDSATAILVPVCVNMVVGQGAQRELADASIAYARTTGADAKRGKTRQCHARWKISALRGLGALMLRKRCGMLLG